MIAQREMQKPLERSLEVMPAGMGFVVIGYRLGLPDADVHGIVYCCTEHVFTMLGKVDELVGRHFPCHLCAVLGYGPEQLRRDLQTVLPVQ